MTGSVQWPARGRRALLWSGLAVVGLLGLYVGYLWAVVALPKGEERPPVLLFASPFLLKPGLSVEGSRLEERLARLGYHPVAGEPSGPGEYRITEAAVDLYVHDDPDRFVRGTPVRLALENGRISQLLSMPLGEPIPPVPLEPPLLGGLRGASRQVKQWVPLTAMPRTLIDAVLATEDRRYYQHVGVDPLAIARALWANLRSGEVVQGGSTITQQLAKNLFYSRERTAFRKIKEALAALMLELKYGKDEILESYLNEIYLGQVESVSIYGVGEAARWYFGKSVQDMTLAEAALLAGMIKAPNGYSPLKNPTMAKERRDLVLTRLREENKLSAPEHEAAARQPIHVVPTPETVTDAPYFVDFLITQASDSAGEPFPPGVKIVTTLDHVMQRLAEEALERGLARLEAAHPFLKQAHAPLQGALVALDPKTGGILALVGGRNYRQSQFNRAVQARRQPGSLFKPLVYLAAFEAGSVGGSPLTSASLIPDEPLSLPAAHAEWTPHNYDRRFRGPVTVRTALEQSLNVPAVRVAHAVGVLPIIQLARRLGIHSPLEPNLSLALGTSEVSLLEITSAFGALAQQGWFVSPTPIQTVTASDGQSLWPGVPERRQAVSPAAAYIMTSLLKGVVERGTAVMAKRAGITVPVAGKTSTTDSTHDAWFVGYTPDLAIGVWVGFDDASELRLTGAQAALPMWADFVRQVIPPDSPDFPVPGGILTRKLDPKTGQLATSKCPESIEEVFIEGTEPTEYCALHGEGFWDRIKRAFRF